MLRIRLPPRPSCRSCASCMRSCSLVRSRACACSRARACASSARASVTPFVSARLKRSTLRTRCMSCAPSSSITSEITSNPLNAAQLRATFQRSTPGMSVVIVSAVTASQHSASSMCRVLRPSVRGRHACHWNCRQLAMKTHMAPCHTLPNQRPAISSGTSTAVPTPTAARAHSACSTRGSRCPPKRRVKKQADST